MALMKDLKKKNYLWTDPDNPLCVCLITSVPDRIQILNLGLPKSAVGLVPGTGVSLYIGDAYIKLHGNWRVKYLKIVYANIT